MYKIWSWCIFCLVPALLLGLGFAFVHPIVGVVVFAGVLAFTSDLGTPRHERGEQ